MKPKPKANQHREIAAKSVLVKERKVTLVLTSGEKVVLPVAKFPRLADATAAQLARVKLRRNGQALRWDALDEDIQVALVVPGIRPFDGLLSTSSKPKRWP